MEAAAKLTTLVRTGVELVKMVLSASGPDAASLLTANMPSAPGPDGASPADSLQQWRMVAQRVALSSPQRAALADWRSRFLHRIDDCYGRRLLLKAQLAQLPGAGGAAGPQWVEALLLQAAESVGYSGARQWGLNCRPQAPACAAAPRPRPCRAASPRRPPTRFPPLQPARLRAASWTPLCPSWLTTWLRSAAPPAPSWPNCWMAC